MSGQPLVVVGGGRHAREVFQIIRDVNSDSPVFDVLGYVADGRRDDAAPSLRSVAYLGPVAAAEGLGARYVIGIGDGGARAVLDRQLTGAGLVAATLVHPSASVGDGVIIGPGSVLFQGVRLTVDIELGRHVHCSLNSSVSHDSRLASYVTLSPGVVLAGGVSIGEEATLGINSSVLPRVSVGDRSVVGAGAVVTTSVGPDVTAVGVPARVV